MNFSECAYRRNVSVGAVIVPPACSQRCEARFENTEIGKPYVIPTGAQRNGGIFPVCSSFYGSHKRLCGSFLHSLCSVGMTYGVRFPHSPNLSALDSHFFLKRIPKASGFIAADEVTAAALDVIQVCQILLEFLKLGTNLQFKERSLCLQGEGA